MEAFSLLNYWRGAPRVRLLSSSTTATTTTKILTAADDDNDAGDDGPFFDIEFTLPDDAEDGKHNHHNEEDEESEGEKEFNISLSPSHDLFFKGKLLHVVEDAVDPSSSEPNTKPHHFNTSFFKSATKFRVFMSALKKSKSASSSSNAPSHSLPPESSHKNKESFKNNNKESSPEERQRFSKEAMQKYLKMVKPLYVKVSRRYEKGTPFAERTQKKHDPLKEDNSEGVGSSSSSNSTNNKSQKVTAGLGVVCKHLGKSRSASSAVAAAPPLLSSKRRDDSLLQQQDGIQGAILHCKSSFNASIECEIPPQLPRCVSEPLHEK